MAELSSACAGRVWVFDLDNTMIASSRAYGYAVVEFIKLMLDVFAQEAPTVEEIDELRREIDNERVRTHGAVCHRFPVSLVICYCRLCEKLSVPVDKGVVSQVYQIGEESSSIDFYRQDQLIPGVEETLDFLRAQGDEILVLTKGDPLVQWRKWWGYGLYRWFPTSKEFRVVRWEPRAGYPGDKEPALAELRREHPDRKIYMVGDSIVSDMIPAIKAEVIPIYVPGYAKWNWRKESSPLPEETIVLEKIADIIERYDKL